MNKTIANSQWSIAENHNLCFSVGTVGTVATVATVPTVETVVPVATFLNFYKKIKKTVTLLKFFHKIT